jgi:hypothetical protein
MPTDAEVIATKVERHDRILFGNNGKEPGMVADVRELQRYSEEMKLERKEAKDDRRHIMAAVIAGTCVNVIAILVALAITHTLPGG